MYQSTLIDPTTLTRPTFDKRLEVLTRYRDDLEQMRRVVSGFGPDYARYVHGLDSAVEAFVDAAPASTSPEAVPMIG